MSLTETAMTHIPEGAQRRSAELCLVGVPVITRSEIVQGAGQEASGGEDFPRTRVSPRRIHGAWRLASAQHIFLVPCGRWVGFSRLSHDALGCVQRRERSFHRAISLSMGRSPWEPPSTRTRLGHQFSPRLAGRRGGFRLHVHQRHRDCAAAHGSGPSRSSLPLGSENPL